MFQSLFKRAEVAIEQSVGQVITRVLIAVPFLIAAGFGTAALSLRLNRQFDAETSNLIMAGLFGLVGLACAMVFALKSAPEKNTGTASSAEAIPPQSEPESNMAFSDTDRELLIAALTSAAPIALPQVARMVMRNLPVLAAIGAAIFVMTRPANPPEHMTAAE
jgi:ABC-type antimicrobial peptide transport system permease subunit